MSSSRPATKNPRLARIQIHPVKSLDPVEVQTAIIGSAGSLQFDRAWAIYTLDGRLINATRVPAMHLIRAVYAPNFANVTLSVSENRRNLDAASFVFPTDTGAASA